MSYTSLWFVCHTSTNTTEECKQTSIRQAEKMKTVNFICPQTDLGTAKRKNGGCSVAPAPRLNKQH